ncbi:hypothetical protein O9993_17275 [Vibrio lentus]|nr:hypothetical protein [Vibrio lentus]
MRWFTLAKRHRRNSNKGTFEFVDSTQCEGCCSIVNIHRLHQCVTAFQVQVSAFTKDNPQALIAEASERRPKISLTLPTVRSWMR